MRKHLWWAALGLALLAGAAQAGPGLELAEVLKAVESGDPALAAARAEAARMQGLARAAGSWPAPRLGLEAMAPGFGGLGQPLARRWSLAQELPLPPRTSLLAEAAEREAGAAAAEAAGLRLESLAAARQAYWELAAACRLQGALERLASATAEMAALSRRRADFGQLDRMGQFMDSMLAMEDSRLRSLLPQAAQRRSAASAALQRLMGGDPLLDAGEPAAGPEALLRGELPAPEQALARAERRSPALRAAAERLAAARAARLAALGGWLPDLMLQASLEEDEQGGRQSGAMLALSLPWLWWGRAAGESAAAAAALEQARAREALARLELRRQVAEALGAARASRESLALALRGTLPAAARGLAQARSGFRSAALGPTEILMAVQDYRMAEEGLAELSAAAGSALARLELLAGPGTEDKDKEVRP